jgi:hypothetical protein
VDFRQQKPFGESSSTKQQKFFKKYCKTSVELSGFNLLIHGDDSPKGDEFTDTEENENPAKLPNRWTNRKF